MRVAALLLVLASCVGPLPTMPNTPEGRDCSRQCLSLRYQCQAAGESACRDVQGDCLRGCAP